MVAYQQVRHHMTSTIRNHSCKMLKPLLNLPESETDSRLREVCDDFDARVFAKVRVADVLQIERSGIDDVLYRYALQAHFDFIITG